MAPPDETRRDRGASLPDMAKRRHGQIIDQSEAETSPLAFSTVCHCHSCTLSIRIVCPHQRGAVRRSRVCIPKQSWRLLGRVGMRIANTTRWVARRTSLLLFPSSPLLAIDPLRSGRSAQGSRRATTVQIWKFGTLCWTHRNNATANRVFGRSRTYAPNSQCFSHSPRPRQLPARLPPARPSPRTASSIKHPD